MMKRTFVLIAVMLCVSGLAIGQDYVDIGDLVSEAGHVMASWGPIEPANSGGAFGGVANCRTIWSSFDNSTNATIQMTFPSGTTQVAFRHLEGVADDGFQVLIDGNLFYTHTELQTTEMWFISGFNCSLTAGLHTVEFIATGAAWPSWATYGQVCIDWIEVGGGAVTNEAGTWGVVKTLYR